jgi:colanic acid/amylovoran biosynthesis glycosyltransferase
MRRAWLLPGERMPVARQAAPQLRFARVERWLGELGYEPRTFFERRLRLEAKGERGTVRALLDALTSVTAAPWLAIKASRERPALLFSSSAMNAPTVALIKRLLGDRVVVIVDALGLRSLESEQTTRMRALRSPLRLLWRRLERNSFANADLVLAVNDRNAELIREMAPGASVATLRDAAEADLVEVQAATRESYGIPGDGVVVGFMGSLVCSRLERLLSAWETLSERGDRSGTRLHLVIVGSGPDLRGYAQRVTERMPDSVTLLGARPRDESLAVLRACDIAYTGSWSRAGFSFKLFEYMALGRPILVERKPQMEEVLTDGVDALFYDGPEDLALKIERLAGEPSLRRDFGEAAKRTFLEGHTLERRRAQFKDLVGSFAGRTEGLHLFDVGLSWPPETFVGWRLRALAERGVRLTVAANLRPGAMPPAPGDIDFDFIRIPSWNDTPSRKAIRLLRDGLPFLIRHPRRLRTLVRGIRELPPGTRALRGVLDRLQICIPLARVRPDVAHFDWESSAVNFLPLYEVWDCPVVVSCHGAGVNRHPLSARLGKRLQAGLPTVFAKAAAVHSVADAVTPNAVRYGADPRSVKMIPSGVDPAFFAPDGAARAEAESLRLVGVARLVPTKGHEFVLSAVRRLVDRGVPVRYELLGGEPRRKGGVERTSLPRVLHTIEDLELEPFVELRGRVDSEVVRDTLRRSDVFVHPSISEGMPTVIAEAMSCGVPVVVTDVGGAREMVRDGIDGFVVPPRDPEALAGAIEALWENPALRAELGQAGRARVQEEFSLDSVTDRFVDLLESTARGADG